MSVSCFFFFCKQKTAYEMRISDWSSDVCFSDLQLVEEGFEAVLSRKQRATPAVARIFDGEKEAKLIALACSKPPKGRARWTLRLLEKKVEIGRASCRERVWQYV